MSDRVARAAAAFAGEVADLLRGHDPFTIGAGIAGAAADYDASAARIAGALMRAGSDDEARAAVAASVGDDEALLAELLAARRRFRLALRSG